MHWPYPPNPAEYQSPGLGLVLTMLAVVLIFLVVLFYATESSRSQLHEAEPVPDETETEEKRGQEK